MRRYFGTALFGVVFVLLFACATQQASVENAQQITKAQKPTQQATHQTEPETPQAQPTPSPLSGFEHPVGVLEADPEGRPRMLQLVVIRPADISGDSALVQQYEKLHRRHLLRLHEAGIAAASGRIEDGRRLMILSAGGSGLASERLLDDPYFQNPARLRMAGFQFSVGNLCQGPPAADERELQLVWFHRDIEVLKKGGEPAPAPFGAGLAQTNEVLAAGAWGYGHEGVVFLDAGSLDRAEDLLASWPIEIDPQWSYELHTVRMPGKSLCR